MAITPQHEKGEPTEADLAHAYEKARSIGLFLVEKYARECMRLDTDFEEFVMAMGTANFWIGDESYEAGNSPELSELLLAWDDVLKLTGEPMRFTADGPVRREW